MRRWLGALVSVVVVAGLAPQAAPAQASPGERPLPRRSAERLEPDKGPHRPTTATDHVLVRFRRAAPAKAVDRVLRSRGTSRSAAAIGRTGWMEVPTRGQRAEVVRASLAKDPAVAAARLDVVRRAHGSTNDVYYADFQKTYLQTVRLPSAWDATHGSTGIVIAVVDTGVRSGHEDLAGKLVAGYDFVDNDVTPQDGAGHGTSVAGVAGAATNNGKGIAGAGWSSKIMPVRVLDANGEGTDADIASGITWAVDHGADVVNLSLGGLGTDPVLESAVNYALNHNVVVVASSGNAGWAEPEYPASYPGVISVGATDETGHLASFSNWGDTLSLTAPGWGLIAPVSTGNTDYDYVDGTSFSAPLVAGVAALVRAKYPTWSAAAVRSRLLASARDAGPRGLDRYYGHGVLDAASALGAPAAAAWPLAAEPAGEPGDLAAGAVPPRGSGLTLKPEGDVDWFRFAAAATGKHEIQVTLAATPELSAQAFDPVLRVYDASKRLLATFDDSFPGESETLYLDLPAAGDYLLEVSNWNGGIGGSTYGVSVTPAPDAPLFRPSWDLDLGEPLLSSAVGDVSGDGLSDLLVTTKTALLVGPGRDGGGFDDFVELPYPGGTTFGDIVVADLNGDGRNDVAVGGSGGITPYLQSVDGELNQGTLLPVPGTTGQLRSGDVGDDGDTDLLTWTSTDTIVVVNDPAVGFTATAGPQGSPYDVEVADVTGDARADLVSATGGGIDVHPGTTGDGFGGAVAYPVASGARSVVAADLDGDGRTDVAATGSQAAAVTVLHQRGDGTFDPQGSVASLGDLPGQVEAADLDGDDRDDLVVVLDATDKLATVRQNPDGSLAPAREHAAELAPTAGARAMSIGDAEADGSPDVVVASTTHLSVVLQYPRPAADGPRAWVVGSSVSPNATGQPRSAPIELRLGRGLDGASVTDSTVRLLDGTTGAAVPAARNYSGDVLTVTPSQPLRPMRPYVVSLAGVRDTEGRTFDEGFRLHVTTAGPPGLRFSPLTPTRFMDTRSGLGVRRGRVPSGGYVDLTVAGVKGVPANAQAVVLNLTGVAPAGGVNVTAYPKPASGTAYPTASNLNLLKGETRANLVTVKVGSGGKVRFRSSGSAVDLVADVAGFYAPSAATGFSPVTPTRLMDTRYGTGVRRGVVPAGGFVELTVAGRSGVPADATAVVLNVTAVRPSASTYISVYPRPLASAAAPPTVSNINLRTGQIAPNLVTVAVGTDGKIRLRSGGAAVHLLADLAGYYATSGATGFTALSPTRVLDTRAGLGAPKAVVRAGASRDVDVTKVSPAGKTPVSSGVPSGAAAVVMNVTGVRPVKATHVSVFPTPASGSAVPTVSNLNLVAGEIRPNLVSVQVGAADRVRLYPSTSDLHLVADLAGYFRS